MSDSENSSKNRYVNAINDISKDAERYFNYVDKEDYDTKYALAYLIDNLEFIKLKYSSFSSATRNYEICYSVHNKFHNADIKKLSAFLSRKGIWTNGDLFKFNCLIFTIFQLTVWFIFYQLMKGDKLINDPHSIVTMVFSSLLVSALLIGTIHMVYTESSVLKFYRTNISKARKSIKN